MNDIPSGPVVESPNGSADAASLAEQVPGGIDEKVEDAGKMLQETAAAPVGIVQSPSAEAEKLIVPAAIQDEAEVAASPKPVQAVEPTQQVLATAQNQSTTPMTPGDSLKAFSELPSDVQAQVKDDIQPQLERNIPGYTSAPISSPEMSQAAAVPAVEQSSTTSVPQQQFTEADAQGVRSVLNAMEASHESTEAANAQVAAAEAAPAAPKSLLERALALFRTKK